MDILIINHNGGSIYHGPNLRTYYAAKELVSLGHKVTIASSSFSHKYSNPPIVRDLVTEEDIDGIEYKWVKCVEYKNLLQRIYSHFEFGFKCCAYLSKVCSSADVVVFSGPPPEISLFAKVIARRLKAPLVCDVRDLWPRTQIEMNKLQWLNPFTYFLFFCQWFLARFSERIVSPLPGADSYMRSVGAKHKTYVIENGFDTTRVSSKDDTTVTIAGCSKGHDFEKGDEVSLSKLKEKHPFIVGYAGAFDRDNDIDSFLEAAVRLIENKKILFLMIGDGLRKEEVLELSGRLPNLVIGERVCSEKIPSILAKIDVLYCALKPKAIYQYGVSLAKSYEYMASAKPVIWMIDACNNPIAASGGGWTVEPGNIEQLVYVISNAFEMSTEQRQSIGNNAREYLERKHSYAVLGLLWQGLLNDVVSAGKAR